MINNETTFQPAPAITPRALRKIANDLIDEVAGQQSANENERHLHIGAISGIRDMCTAAMEALPKTPLQRAHQPGGLALSDIPWSTVRLGEQKAGTILDVDTGIIYDLMLLPGETEDVTWAQAKVIATSAGGDLPSAAEMLMLESLLGAAAFKSDAYWTIQTARFEGDAQDSIQYFTDRCFDFTEPNDQMSVRGVRRVMVGHAADDKPCADTTAPAAPSAGPDLSDRPDLQQMRAALLKPVPPLTGQAIVSVLDELSGIRDADDDAQLAADVCTRVIDVINGLMLIVDPEQIK
jgi:hypothetical protein